MIKAEGLIKNNIQIMHNSFNKQSLERNPNFNNINMFNNNINNAFYNLINTNKINNFNLLLCLKIPIDCIRNLS